MSWLQKISGNFYGDPSPKGLNLYEPIHTGDYGAIYQSKDFPHVFLGSSNTEDIKEAERIAGKPICFRVDVAALDNNELGKADLSLHLPERKMWDQRSEDEVQSVFDAAANKLAEIILEKNCPIYVHCFAGINRSVAVLAAALAKLTGKKAFEVLREIRSQRQVSPADNYLYLLARYNDSKEDPEQVRQLLEV
jgi:protein tyrosine/serine phosphatase